MIQSAKKLKKLLKDKNIIDIIIFGSSIKGKITPEDIDVAILVKEKLSKLNLQKQIEFVIGKKVDLQLISIDDYDKFIWLTLIKEGFSIKHNRFLYELYKTMPVKLYKYSLNQLTNSKKVMFSRGIKNFSNIKKLSNRVVLVPMSQTKEFEDFLKLWNLDIDSKEYELLPVMRKSDI